MHPGYSPWTQFWSNNVTRKLHKCRAFCSPFVPKMGRACFSGDTVMGGWFTALFNLPSYAQDMEAPFGTFFIHLGTLLWANLGTQIVIATLVPFKVPISI